MDDAPSREEAVAPLPADPNPSKPDSVLKQRMRRNRAIALMVVGFCVLIYLVTILRLAGSVGA